MRGSVCFLPAFSRPRELPRTGEPDLPLRVHALPGVHGVYYDPTTRLLWAAGNGDLVGLDVGGTSAAPKLRKIVDTPLPVRPTSYGHDVHPVRGNVARSASVPASVVGERGTGEGQADVVVDVSAARHILPDGGWTSVYVQVRNAGTAVASGVRFSVTLPPELQETGSMTTNQWDCW
ncbi:hypothetical protein [Amycolatopsis sp. NPDC051372]|uniref:hypothetical protein n=1 Tax=Amycolatopsis sp. NPDC051372 TaxID=3155669 RepID=UPI003446009B